jgi:hypothetical protein
VSGCAGAGLRERRNERVDAAYASRVRVARDAPNPTDVYACGDSSVSYTARRETARAD